MAYPKECPVLRLKTAINTHWRKGDIVELTEVEPVAIGDYPVIHHCDSHHWAYLLYLTSLHPLTPAASQMLAIARGRR